MHFFLPQYKKLTQKETENLNSPTIIKYIGNLKCMDRGAGGWKNKEGLDHFIDEFYQAFKELITLVLDNLFQGTEKEEMLQKQQQNQSSQYTMINLSLVRKTQE